VAGPGIEQGLRYVPITTMDLTSTVLDLAGAAPLPDMDGSSALPAMTGPDRPWTMPVVTEGLIKDVRVKKWTDLPTGLTTSGLRVGRWKLIRYANGDAELYDELLDPNELDSVYDDPAHRAIRDEMARLWEKYKDCRGAACRVPLPADLQEDDAWLARQDQDALQAKKAYYDQ
jgi:arylsulfatase A-like enzyme